MKILMVCLGNICRSPLAEGILKQKIKDKNLGWIVDSAGTGSWHIGELPDPRSVAEALKNDIDITDQRARQFSKSDFENFDLILTMDESNYDNVVKLAGNPTQIEKVKMIMDFIYPGKKISIPDPYWNDDGFSKVFEMLSKATEQLIKNVEEGKV